MTMSDWTIKFAIMGEQHYMTIPARTAQEAQAIFKEWMWGPSGEMKDDPTPNKVWRQLEGRKRSDATVFRNDWIAGYEVLEKRFIIT